MSLPKLTKRNSKTFFEKLRVSDLFSIAQGYTHDQVIVEAKKVGLSITYCPPGSDQYALYGPAVYRVLSQDYSGPVESCVDLLRASEDRGILLKDVLMRDGLISRVKSIVFTDKTRTEACKFDVFCQMLSNGLIAKVSESVVSGKINQIYKVKTVNVGSLF
jgi:hypothetical protein